MPFFGGSSSREYEPREVGALYEKIGRKHVSEATGSAGLGLISVVADLTKEVGALRREVALLEGVVRDLRKPKRK